MNMKYLKMDSSKENRLLNALELVMKKMSA